MGLVYTGLVLAGLAEAIILGRLWWTMTLALAMVFERAWYGR